MAGTVQCCGLREVVELAAHRLWGDFADARVQDGFAEHMDDLTVAFVQDRLKPCRLLTA